jgi:hypothetical protein
MSAPGRPPRAAIRRPPGEDKVPEGSAAPSSGALVVAARQLGMSDSEQRSAPRRIATRRIVLRRIVSRRIVWQLRSCGVSYCVVSQRIVA